MTPLAANPMTECFRWFGPGDPVPLCHIRQAGATAVFTALHDISYGEAWPREAIRERKALVEAAGLQWSVVESVPVHEDIKTGQGDLRRLFDNYLASLRHLADEGIRTVIYNFMPVLDWVRTDMRWEMPDGSLSMHFDPVRFAAFEIHALKRRNAEAGYTLAQTAAADAWWRGLDDAARDAFVRSITDVFPGVKWNLTLDDIRAMLARYDGIGETELQANLARFLDAIIPEAEKLGIHMAIHPDDPPFSVLGLPRIVSTAEHLDTIMAMADSPASGICFCTGSLGARPDNDLPAMARRFAPRIHAAHLRSTQLEADGSFYEASHLGRSVDIPVVVATLLDAQARRGADDPLPFRPDHGHRMMDDLAKPEGVTPGYSCIGRMKGLAELRGLMLGLRWKAR